MQFENQSPENAMVARVRHDSLDDPRSCQPLDDDHTHRLTSSRPPTDVGSSCHRMATAMSSAMTHVVMAFAIAAASMYPALLWLLIEHVNQDDAAADPPRSGGSGVLGALGIWLRRARQYW
jgi:hypothetical protein